MKESENIENLEVLSNKSINDLRNIALSMGLVDHKSFTRGDYYNYVVNKVVPVVESYEEKDLEKLSVVNLRSIASQLGINKNYKLKKDQLITSILNKQSNSEENSKEIKLNRINLNQLQNIAEDFKIDNIKNLNKKDLIDKILEAEKNTNLNFNEYYENFTKMNKENNKVDKNDIKVEDLSDNASEIIEDMDSINYVSGILDLHQDGFGFLRVNNYAPGEGDIYVSPSQIRRFKLRNGDEVMGVIRPSKANESYNALIYIKSVNGLDPNACINRPYFDNLTPIYPRQKLTLETPQNDIAMRLMDLISPIGKGQRGMIVSQPKSGKTTLLKKIAKSISENYPETKLIVLLIDERPEEVTDMKRSVKGEVIYSTFDELPKNHTRVAEYTLERAKRLVEQKQDVIILMDSLTRLARAYNLITPSSGKTLSGGLDPISLHKPKRFFGAARNIEEGGSLTILATALVETGSRMDDIIFEEFKGTGNMEVHLDRRMSERKIFPAIDIYKSGTRKDEYLLSDKELEFTWSFKKAMSQESSLEVTEVLLDKLIKSKSNSEFLNTFKGKFKKYD